ncbi:hypothetical protein AAC387_Pa08g1984 [Persea americana]
MTETLTRTTDERSSSTDLLLAEVGAMSTLHRLLLAILRLLLARKPDAPQPEPISRRSSSLSPSIFPRSELRGES